MRFLIVIFILFEFSFSELIKEMEFNANVLNIKQIRKDFLISLDNGEIEILDENFTQKMNYKFPKIKTYFGDLIESRIFSADLLDDEILVLLSSDFGAQKLEILGKKDFDLKSENFKNAFFINKNLAILADLSGEIYFFDLQNGKMSDPIKISSSSLSSVEISPNRKILVLASEGGKVYVFDIVSKKILSQKSLHKDRIHDLAISSNLKIATGANDKSASFFDFKNDIIKNFESEFLVYAVSISENGKTLAYQSSENGDITLINTQNFEISNIIKTNDGNLGSIILNNNFIVTSNFDKKIKIWSIK
ncbi:WD40 repeat domain-containing protein [Campylobacter hominis]